MSRILTIFTLVIFSVSYLQAQDKIYKKSGEVLETKVIEIGTTEVKYKVFANQTGPVYVLSKNDLIKIVYESGTVENFTASEVILKTNDKRAQNIYAEYGAQGLLLSANYDTRFGKRRNGLGGRIGIGAFGVDQVTLITIPVSLNYLLGSGKNFFEIGLGATYTNLSMNNDAFFGGDTVIGTMAFMYRLQPETSGFSFRGGLTPFFNSSGFIPFAGISLGYTF